MDYRMALLPELLFHLFCFYSIPTYLPTHTLTYSLSAPIYKVK